MSESLDLISSKEQLDLRLIELVGAIKAAHSLVAERAQQSEPIEFFADLKFKRLVNDPHHTASGVKTNLFEFSNQLWTTVATYKAIHHLLEVQPASQSRFILNLGTKGGRDVLSEDGDVIAEVFASTRHDNNSKLRDELKKLSGESAPIRYVFALVPDEQVSRLEAYKPKNFDVRGVTVKAFGLLEVMRWLEEYDESSRMRA